jgi:hypothetical protein
MDRVVSTTSEKTVIRRRVPLGETDFSPAVITALISGFVSTIGVAMPLNLVARIDIGLSFLAAGGTTLGAVAAAVGIMYAVEVDDDTDYYAKNKKTGFKQIMKSVANMALPFGQRWQIGDTAKINLSTRKPVDSLATVHYDARSNGNHEVKTYTKFTPLGVYIEQEISAQPIAVWDNAFESTKEVHKFDNEKAQLEAKAKKILL